MQKLIPVLISNKTFLAITLCGHDIRPSKANQRFETGSLTRLKSMANALYPNELVITEVSSEAATTQQTQTPVTANVEKTALDVLDLSSSVEKALAGAGVEYVEQLTAMTEQNVVDVKGIANAGLQEIKEALAVLELALLNEGVNDE